MKQKIVLFIITIAMIVSCFAVVGADNGTNDSPGDMIVNPWGHLFEDGAGTIDDFTWEAGKQKYTTKYQGQTEAVPAKAVIKKIYKKKYASNKIKMSVKKAANAVGYQVVVFKTKKNAKNLRKPIYVKSFFKTKFTLKSKKFKKKKKLFVRVRAFNYTKIGTFSKIKKVKIKK